MGRIAHPLITTSCPFLSRPSKCGICSKKWWGKLTSNISQHSGISCDSVLASRHSTQPSTFVFNISTAAGFRSLAYVDAIRFASPTSGTIAGPTPAYGSQTSMVRPSVSDNLRAHASVPARSFAKRGE